MSCKCDLCGESFKNDHGVSMHKAYSHDNPWQDEDRLWDEYVKNERSMDDIAEEWGCDSSTVGNWLDRFGIEKREAKDYNRVEYADYNQHEQGYERWQDHYGEDRGVTVFVHRLLAVAKYGFDSVKGKHVHHKKSIPWLNTYWNIELKDPSEHAKEHYDRGDLQLEPGGITEAVEELQGEL